MVDKCKLCGAKSALVRRSHVIPRWMYDLLPQDKRGFRIASSHECEFETKSRMGTYGKYVCQACENLFSRWDDLAAKVLCRGPALTPYGRNFGAYVYGDLARFYLSVLWRASACGQKFFETVDLKEQQAALGEALISKDDSCLDRFDIRPSCSEHLLACGVMTPMEVTVQTVPHWQLYMPVFQALIKVTDRPGAPSLQPYKLRPNSPLYLREKDFTEFGEVQIAMQAVRANLEKKNAHSR